MWGSASEPAGSVPSTQSQKKRGGDYRAMASCQGVLNEGWKRVKESGFDWWMVWKWVSWGGSSTTVNVSPCTRPSCVRNSLVCIKADVFLPARPISWCWCVLPGVDTVRGVQKVEWLWEWCHCRAAISPMPGSIWRCVYGVFFVFFSIGVRNHCWTVFHHRCFLIIHFDHYTKQATQNYTVKCICFISLTQRMWTFKTIINKRKSFVKFRFVDFFHFHIYVQKT